jgi:glycerol-1-phosphate dehydrogenase [NAD(P)+]
VILDTVKILFQEGALKELPALCKEVFGDVPFLVISDETIWNATGKLREEFPSSVTNLPPFLLPAEPIPYANNELVSKIKTVIDRSGAVPIAFGSGTINDGVKRAAFECGRRYLCIPTAPSVDGYTASGASINVNGFKITLDCPAPLAVVADLRILEQSPLPLIASGYGDLTAKIFSSVDWTIADLLGVEPIRKDIWESMYPKAVSVFEKGREVQTRNRTFIKELFEGLLASGLGMQAYGASRPASGAEHLFSHVWEMGGLVHGSVWVSHGFQVAVGSLLSRAVMEELFKLSIKEVSERIRMENLSGNLLEKRLKKAEQYLGDSGMYRDTLSVIHSKTPSPTVLEERRKRILDTWDLLREKCTAFMPSFEKLKQLLSEAGCPTEPGDLGLTPAGIRFGMEVAQLIRTRYTVLDLMAEIGVTESLIKRILEGSYFTFYA